MEISEASSGNTTARWILLSPKAVLKAYSMGSFKSQIREANSRYRFRKPVLEIHLREMGNGFFLDAVSGNTFQVFRK